MEEISSLIWLGIAVVWFLTRLLRRGARKVASTQKKSPRPSPPRPEPRRTRIESQPGFSNRGGKGPPPIVPR